MENRDELIIKPYQSGCGQTECYKKGKRQKDPTLYTEEQEQIALDCYVNQKRGLNYCKAQAKVSLATLNQILKDNGIKKRTYAEAAIESNQNRALHKNKEYFSIQSPNMAWVLGFLAADGTVSKKGNNISIKLSSADKEILERIKQDIEIENPIHNFTNHQGFDYSELSWTCKEHREELTKYSIVPQKTFILEPPYALDKKYWLDYVRGYFDGDGSVNFIKVNGKKHCTALRWQVCSATPSVLEFVLNVLEYYGIPKVNIQKQNRKSSTLYCVQYSTNSTKKIYEILYSTPSTLYLARKKQHFEEIIQRINNK